MTQQNSIGKYRSSDLKHPEWSREYLVDGGTGTVRILMLSLSADDATLYFYNPWCSDGCVWAVRASDGIEVWDATTRLRGITGPGNTAPGLSMIYNGPPIVPNLNAVGLIVRLSC